jgi:GT2 family glycosyltransferase
MIPDNNRNVTVIIVTYRRTKLLLNAVTSALNGECVKNVIIVDNNSESEKELPALIAAFQGMGRKAGLFRGINTTVWQLGNVLIHHLSEKQNRGGAGGFETGAAYSLDVLGDRFTIFMDDDAQFKHRSIDCLIEFALRTPAAFWAPLVYNAPSSEYELGQHKVSLDPCSLHEDHPTTEDIGGESVPLVANGFVGVMVETGHLARVGGVFAEYFILYDDVDLTYRLSQRLGPGRLVTQALLYHHYDSNSHSPYWKKLANIRSRLIFIGRNGRGLRAYFYRLRLSLTGLAFAMRAKSVRSRFRATSVVLAALFGVKHSFYPTLFD